MAFLTLLSVLFPILTGLALLVWRPAEKKTRERYVMSAVLLSSVCVLGACAAALFSGAESVACTLLPLNGTLSVAFRPDGASVVFGCIIGVLWPLTTLYAFSYMEHEEGLNRFYGFFLTTYGVVAGIAFSANFFTLYLFYELMTLATLPLVMHEMDGKARSAGKKYVIYSMSGAALIFIAMVFLIQYGEGLDFRLGGVLSPAGIRGREELLRLVFVLGFFGFGVKAAIFPLHDWLPSASVAPTPVTALLHAVAVVKAGAFGVLRLSYYGFGPALLRGTWAQAAVVCAAALTILYGSAMALRAGHLKRRLAYSTVANLSYILLAFALMTRESLAGGLLHMIFHAVIKITLFFCAGAILHNNRLEYIEHMEGLGKKMPLTCAAFTFMSLALAGIPPLGGFISKWTIGAAAVSQGSWFGYVGAAGLIASAILTMLYMVPVLVRFYFPVRAARPLPENCHEADRRMTVPLGLLCALCLLLSLLSAPLSRLLAAVGAGL